MENTRVLKAMWKWIENEGVNWTRVQKDSCGWLDVYDWTAVLGEKITTSRLTSMYNAGLLDRAKDKSYFGNDRFHYFPIITPDNSWN